MDEKQIIYEIILDIWDLFKSNVVGKQHLTDDNWKDIYSKCSGMRNKYLEKGNAYKSLFMNLLFALEKYVNEREQDG